MTLSEFLLHEARLAQRGAKAVPAIKGARTFARERDLHDAIAAFCKARGWFFVHSRMDQKTTTATGIPDFAIAADTGKTIWVEAKTRGGKLTPQQLITLAHLKKLGHVVGVVRSMEEFAALLNPPAL